MTRIKIEFDVPADVDAAFRSGTRAAVIPLSHVAVEQLGRDVILSHEAMGALADSLFNFLAGREATVQPDAELRAALEDIAAHLRGCGERLERTREVVGRAVFVTVYPGPRGAGGDRGAGPSETPEEGRRRASAVAAKGLMKHLGIEPKEGGE